LWHKSFSLSGRQAGTGGVGRQAGKQTDKDRPKLKFQQVFKDQYLCFNAILNIILNISHGSFLP